MTYLCHLSIFCDLAVQNKIFNTVWLNANSKKAVTFSTKYCNWCVCLKFRFDCWLLPFLFSFNVPAFLIEENRWAADLKQVSSLVDISVWHDSTCQHRVGVLMLTLPSSWQWYLSVWLVSSTNSPGRQVWALK